MLQIGAWNTLKVIRSKEHGIYLGEEDGKTAETVLLPRKQVPEGVRIGETMRVFLYRDSEDRMIATTTEPYIIMGEIKKLTVKHVTNIGAFMDWGLEKDILLPFKEQTAKLSEGKSYL
ncbi:MAG: S1-like domain-containing RNA-binding protein, partial [Lachnospiraceae bacterium]|nr:S1-like domain-containing RNA-binding protein [Lachnospiraceae bacterium]